MEQFKLGNNSFPLTTAGLVTLAKYIVDNYVEPLGDATRHFNNVVNARNYNLTEKDRTNIFRYLVLFLVGDKYRKIFRNYDKNSAFIRALSHLTTKLTLPADDVNYYFTFWDFDYLKGVAFSNVVSVYSNGYDFKDKTFIFEGVRFPLKVKRFLRTCTECGQRYFDQEAIIEAGYSLNEVAPNGLIGYDGYCNNCASYYYQQCDCCGEWSDDTEWCENSEIRVCRGCIENGEFAYCEQCGALIDLNGDYEYSNEYGYYFCNSDCAENYGLHYDYDEDDWVDYEENAIDDIIGGYHTHSYDSVVSSLDKHPQLKVGVEIEIDGMDAYNFDYDYWDNVQKMLGNHAFMERDGSVEVEIVSQPHTEREFRSFDWATILNKLSKDGWRSHDCETCGQHFHFSQAYLGYNDSQIKDSAKKIAKFFQLYWDDIVKFSRRKSDQLHWCEDYNFEISKKTDFYDLRCNRYKAVNVCNLFNGRKSTIEIRIARGTLNPSTFMANYDFLLHIVRHAKKISWKNVHKAKLWLKGIDKNTIAYLKERDCSFGGAI